MKLSMNHVKKQYASGKIALEDISLDLEAPSMVGLLGPNGAGKSTLMQLLVAGILPTSGQIFLDGGPLSKQEQELKQHLGYLPQRFGLYDELTVEQFLDYMAALKDCSDKAVIQRVLE